jgi:hypothetical protein
MFTEGSMTGSRSIALALYAAGLLILTLCFPPPAPAQDSFPLWEANGGFSYQRLRAPGLPSSRNAIGGWGGFAWNPHRRFGLAAEFAGQKNPECAQNDIECIIEQITAPQFVTFSSLQFLGGPRVRSGGDTLDFFAHGQAGLARTRVTVIDLTTSERSEFRSGARLALAFGVGMDWNVADAFAIRAFQLDYIPVRHSADWRHNIRLQVGAVFRFGQRDRFP